jgi:hypothetical protein
VLHAVYWVIIAETFNLVIVHCPSLLVAERERVLRLWLVGPLSRVILHTYASSVLIDYLQFGQLLGCIGILSSVCFPLCSDGLLDLEHAQDWWMIFLDFVLTRLD